MIAGSKCRNRQALGAWILTAAIVVSGALLCPDAALAWKPDTHIFAANIALQDALADGKVTIPPFGEFAVNPDALQALRAFPASYRAGVLGPDVFPDVFVGQSYAHADHSGDASHCIANDWMQQVMTSARVWQPAEERNRALAFAYGFLTHAGGDMFGHTYINGYAGGIWNYGNPPLVSRHVVLEGYIAKHLPPTDVTIEVWPRFVSETLIKSPFARDHALGAKHYQFWLKLYDWLGRSLDRINKEMNEGLPQNASDDLKKARHPILWAKREYMDGWRKDIDRGLRALVETHQQIGTAVMVGRLPDALDAFSAWKTEWVPKMLGGHAIGEFLTWVREWDPLAPISEAIREQVLEWVDQAFPQALQVLKMWTDPTSYMPKLYDAATIDTINAELHLGPDGVARWADFGPLYNTVIISKLILLDGRSLNELARRAGVAAPLYGETPNVNVMLQVMKSMDGDHQWQGGTYGMSSSGGAMQASAAVKMPGGLRSGIGSRVGFLFYSNEEARTKVFGRIFKGKDYGPGPGLAVGAPSARTGVQLRK